MDNKGIYEGLIEYCHSDKYPWHMPGHKRRIENQLTNPYAYDVTEVPGVDDLQCPEGIIKQSLEKARDIYDSYKTYYLVNGSTCGILSAIATVATRGSKLLIARNCHKSVYNALDILGIEPIYAYPELLEEGTIPGGITASAIDRIMEHNSDICGVVIVSPTYEGVVSDIESISKVVHSYNVPLIVDSAHGAHFQYGKYFPEPALRCGGDIVIESLHKTMPVLNQGAVIHINKNYLGGVDVAELVKVSEKLEKMIYRFQTTSPSYIIMASMDYGISSGANSMEKYNIYGSRLETFRNRCKDFKHIHLLDKENTLAYDYDKGKLVFILSKDIVKSYKGKNLLEELDKNYNQVLEMAGYNYVIAMTSVMDDENAYDVLYNALVHIDKSLDKVIRDQGIKISEDNTASKAIIKSTYPIPNRVMDRCNAVDRDCEDIPLEKAAGHTSSEDVYIYPPGIPIIAAGEGYTKEIIDLLTSYIAYGYSIRGIHITHDKYMVKVVITK